MAFQQFLMKHLFMRFNVTPFIASGVPYAFSAFTQTVFRILLILYHVFFVIL